LISASLGGGIDRVATFARQRVMISSRFNVMNLYNIDFPVALAGRGRAE
jgi:hypothetical protein